MDYNEALDYIHGTLKFGSKLGLHNIVSLLELMGNPQKKLRFIHVAGTNGKGSTVAFISSILIEAGYKTGVFTSPYIERFTERIRIGHEEIEGRDLARITAMVKEKIEIMLARGENHPTEFEIVTAIAFQYYYEQNCQVVVLEVGLGGRYDSTNVIDTPLVSVITTISYDHMDILGDTLAKIAFEKAGIIKEKGDVVVYPQIPEVEDVFRQVCREKGAKLHTTDFSGLVVKEYGVDGQIFDINDPVSHSLAYENLKISLMGEHQVRNAVLAVKTAGILVEKGFRITPRSLRSGLENARWAGRLEVLCKEPLVIIDGAHNAEGAAMLSHTLDKYFPDKKRILIMGVLRDKDYGSMVTDLARTAHAVIAVTPNSERALPGRELADFIKYYCKNVIVNDTIEDAIGTSLEIAAKDDLICAFGSLYYIGYIRKYFKRQFPPSTYID